MNLKLISSCAIVVVLLSSCLECLDCQVTTDMNLTVEYHTYVDSTSSYNLDSTTNYTLQGLGQLLVTDPAVPIDTNSVIDFERYLSPISIGEFCGEDLKDVKNTSISYDQVSGDSINGLFKYTWTESWDCR